MVPRSLVEYLSSARERDFTSPVMRSPLRIQTESVFCASATPAPNTRQRPANLMCTKARSRLNWSHERRHDPVGRRRLAVRQAHLHLLYRPSLTPMKANIPKPATSAATPSAVERGTFDGYRARSAFMSR